MLKLLRIMGLILGGSLAATGAGATAVLSGSFTADNYVYVYLSTSASVRGNLIGSGNNWQSTFYVSPASLTAGTTYYLNIEAINGDSGGYSAGGFIGDFSLSGATFSNGQAELVTSSANWLAAYNDSNGNNVAQPWVQPINTAVAEGANGVSPWGTVSSVSAAAQWIWASGSLAGNGASAPGNQCAACTIDFQTSFTVPVAAAPEPGSVAIFLTGLGGLGLALRRRRQGVAVYLQHIAKVI